MADALCDALPRFVDDADVVVYVGDVRDILAKLPNESIDCCVTSPPYWGLRDYGHNGQIGLEQSPDQYVEEMIGVFRAVRRLLKPAGTLWLNLGDSYNVRGPKGLNGHDKSTLTGGGPGYQRDVSRSSPRVKGLKPKDLIGMPWRVAFALQEDGWWLRSDIVWAKSNPMPESVTDRPTKSHEYVFLLSKSPRYFYDQDAVREPLSQSTLADARFAKATERNVDQAAERYGEGTSASRRVAGSFFNPKGATYAEASPKAAGLGSGPRVKFAPERNDGNPDSMYKHPPAVLGRNGRTVWEIATQPYPEAHFATFPIELPRRCIAAGCPAGGVVLDPFMGSGTTALAARGLGRRAVGVELNPEYAALCARRLAQQSLLAEDVA